MIMENGKIIIETTDPEEAVLMLSANKLKMFIWELKHNFWRQWKHDDSDLNLYTLREKLNELLEENGITENLIGD
jgi:hypothetical protein